MNSERFNPVSKFKRWRSQRLDRPEYTANPFQSFENEGAKIATEYGIGAVGDLFEYTSQLQLPAQRFAAERGFAKTASMIALDLDPRDYLTISTLSPARKATIDELSAKTMDYLASLKHAHLRMDLLNLSAEKDKSKKEL